jgi:NAD(P)-dependent dehydrogenase (short-subunit alcohol dehydrogenase family)
MSYLDDLFSVRGKTALITGGATGIGRMIATGLAKAGADVLISSRKGADCERVAAELNAFGAGKAKDSPATCRARPASPLWSRQ